MNFELIIKEVSFLAKIKNAKLFLFIYLSTIDTLKKIILIKITKKSKKLYLIKKSSL